MSEELFDLAQGISLALHMRGMTQADLADKLRVSRPTVNMWCNGKMAPRYAMLVRISKALAVNTMFLCDPVGYRRNMAKVVRQLAPTFTDEYKQEIRDALDNK